jgi:hypothetical protein
VVPTPSFNSAVMNKQESFSPVPMMTSLVLGEISSIIYPQKYPVSIISLNRTISGLIYPASGPPEPPAPGITHLSSPQKARQSRTLSLNILFKLLKNRLIVNKLLSSLDMVLKDSVDDFYVELGTGLESFLGGLDETVCCVSRWDRGGARRLEW